MINYLLLYITAGVAVAAASLRVRRHAVGQVCKKADADGALREMYGQYWTEMRALAQRRMLDAPSDEEWLADIRARAEMRSGSVNRCRSPWWMHWVPKVVMSFDFCLLLYFFAGITNVQWADPQPAALGFAAASAAMVTGAGFAFFHFTSSRLRRFKDDAGAIGLRGLDGITSLSLGSALAVIVTLASTAFIRVRAELTGTLGLAVVPAASVGLSLALASILGNALAIAMLALDNSAKADQSGRLVAMGGRTWRAAADGGMAARRSVRVIRRHAMWAAGRPVIRVAVISAVVVAAAPATIMLGFKAHDEAGPAPTLNPQGGPTAAYVADKLYFSRKSAAIPASFEDYLRDVAVEARSQHLAVSITGYASDGGTPAYNQALSFERATAVADQLVALGLPSGQITRVIGLGSAGQSSDVCQAQDLLSAPACVEQRRVVVILSPEKGNHRAVSVPPPSERATALPPAGYGESVV